MTEDEMAGWNHQFNGHEFEQTPGDSEGQGSLAYCSPWGHEESDMTEQLNGNSNTEMCSQSFSSPISTAGPRLNGARLCGQAQEQGFSFLAW